MNIQYYKKYILMCASCQVAIRGWPDSSESGGELWALSYAAKPSSDPHPAPLRLPRDSQLEPQS